MTDPTRPAGSFSPFWRHRHPVAEAQPEGPVESVASLKTAKSAAQLQQAPSGKPEAPEKTEALKELRATFKQIRSTSHDLFARFLVELGGHEDGTIDPIAREATEELQRAVALAFIVLKNYETVLGEQVFEDASSFVNEMRSLASNVIDARFHKTAGYDQTLMKQRHDEWIMRARHVLVNLPMFCSMLSLQLPR